MRLLWPRPWRAGWVCLLALMLLIGAAPRVQAGSLPAAAQVPASTQGSVGTSASGAGTKVRSLTAPEGSSSSAAESPSASAALATGLDVLKPAAPQAPAGRFSTALEIALLMTVLSLLPGALISITSFTRIVIVLSFVRRSLSTNELPPTPIILGLALFLTGFVMAPVAKRVHAAAWVPYSEGRLAPEAAMVTGWGELSGFLLANTRAQELALFTDLAIESGQIIEDDPSDLPFNVVVPAFVLSELKTAFQMGFLLFLPFLVIDLVVASVLLSMGMFMLPPVMVSTPFKVLLFVLVDGWTLISESLVRSFVAA
jgi:flagellar biosynthesis protein FliP